MEQITYLEPVSRRSFLKWGCVGAAALGLTACTGSPAISALSAEGDVNSQIDQPTYEYGQTNTSGRVLVAYASATGSTVEIAAALGETLASEGFAVDVCPMQDQPGLDGYQAVLLGSAVQYGAWLPEAVEYVRANQEALARLPLALFSVHITNQGNDAKSQAKRITFLDAVRPYVQPVTEIFFAGRFNQQGAALMMPGWVARFVPTVDSRKWDLIDTWAENLPAKLFG